MYVSHCFDLKLVGAIFWILHISQVHLDIKNLWAIYYSTFVWIYHIFVQFTNNEAILSVWAILRFFWSIWTNLRIKIWWQLQNCGKMTGLLVKRTKIMKNTNKSGIQYGCIFVQKCGITVCFWWFSPSSSDAFDWCKFLFVYFLCLRFVFLKIPEARNFKFVSFL